jgi:N-acylneuraminate cytidylyltransferase
MELKIKILLQVPELDKIIVNTNSEEAIEIVRNHEAYQENGEGRLDYHRREEYYASSQCSGSDFFKHLGEVTDTDIFVYSPCTSPFVKPETFSKCIKAFLSSENCDCIASVSAVKEFMWLDGKPINYNPLNAPNSQDLPNVVALNFGVTVVGREDLIRNRNIIGKHPNFVLTSEIEAIDIDTPLDFYIAEQLYVKMHIKKEDLLA